MATRNALIALVGAVVIACAAGCGTSSTPTTSAHGPAYTLLAPSGYGPQSVLPFSDLGRPYEVAVDTAGNVYATDIHWARNRFPADTDRVLMLAAGSNRQTVLPYNFITDLAVDNARAVYVVDTRNERLVKLAAGPNTQTVLSFTGFDGEVKAVDSAGNIYGVRGGGEVPGGGCCKPVEVVKLAAGSSTWSVLLTGVNFTDVGVDGAGSLYVVDFHEVLKLAAGASAPTRLPFGDLKNPSGLGVDGGGNVYVADFDNNRVLKLAAGASGPTVLPFTGLNHPTGVAADTAGSVYVADSDRVVELPTQ